MTWSQGRCAEEGGGERRKRITHSGLRIRGSDLCEQKNSRQASQQSRYDKTEEYGLIHSDANDRRGSSVGADKYKRRPGTV